MIADAQKPQRSFEFIVVYDIKRFGRVDNDEAGYYRYILRRSGVDICYVSENFNGDATDDLLRPVKQWQALQESKDLSKVTIRGLLSKMEGDGGWWMGGVPPYGYDLRYENAQGHFLCVLRFMPDGGKEVRNRRGQVQRTLTRGERLSISQKDRAKLMPGCKERITVVQRIFRMYAEQGRGFRAVAQALNAEQVPTPRGPQWSRIYSGLWTDTTVRSILVNPAYAGDLVWNRRTDARFHQIRNRCAVQRESIHGHRLVPNAESDWLVVREAHPPLVSRRLFAQATQRRQDHPSSLAQRGINPRCGRNWSGQRSRFILSGLLLCARCGNRYQGMTRSKGQKKKDGSRTKTRSYACGGYVTKGKTVCDQNPIGQAELETKVIETVLKFYAAYGAEGGKERLARVVQKHLGAQVQDFQAARRRALGEVRRLKSVSDNLLDNITPANRQHVDERLQELSQQRRALELRLEELERLACSQSEISTVTDEAFEFLSGLQSVLENGVAQAKLSALRQCLERVVIDKPGGVIRLHIRELPVAGVEKQQEITVSLG